MSNQSPSTSPSPDAGHEAAPFDWLLALLREAMVGVMADDTPPLKKANALARLGSLYLKTYNRAELKRINAELEGRVAELEERLTAAGEEEVAGQPVPAEQDRLVASMTGAATPMKPRSNGKPHPAKRGHSKPSPRQKLSATGG